MNTQNLTQEIINAIYGQQDAVHHLNNERTLESHFDAIDSFERAINVLAMNNLAKKSFEKAPAQKSDLWNGRLQYTMYKSESAKYEPKTDAPKASIKASIKNLPQPRQYNTTVDSSKEFKSVQNNTKGYRVAGYHFFQKAIVLNLVDADKESREYLLRNEQDSNEEIIHLVFRYMPFDRFGRPNKYDGITQLRDFLKSQKFIVSQKPASLKDALNILVGYTVEFPSLFSYNFTSRSDLLTVYTVYGDFESFEREFSEKDTSEYQSISDFVESDSDSFEYENLQQVIFNNTSNFKQGNIIKHECHKEFTMSLPLEYSHISAIFD